MSGVVASFVVESSIRSVRSCREKGILNGIYSAIAEAAVLISSLPRPFCRRNPMVLLPPGPRDWRIGKRSEDVLSAPILTVRLLPMGPALEYDWSSQTELPVKKLRCLRGLVWLLAPLPKPIELKPEIRKDGSSRPVMPMVGLEAVGVKVGVLEAAVSFIACRRAPLVCNAAGKLADDGAGEGLQDRRSAKDFALRRLLLAAFPKALLSPTSRRPTDDCPRRVL